MQITIQQQIEAVKTLKQSRNALILAHNYQLPEVQDVADYVGDSLELSRIAAEAKSDVIVFCGVYFMAETAAILSPKKTVLIPDPKAGCPMVDMAPLGRVLDFISKHPDAVIVSYVNSSAEVKAISDYCCTSANGVAVVESIDPDRTIVFLPDQHLGDYIAEKTGRPLVLYDGFCPTHAHIHEADVLQARKAHPTAEVLVHPECSVGIRALADVILSTGGMCRYVKQSPSTAFIIGTETGIIHRLKKENPGKTFHAVSKEMLCPNMKRTSLGAVVHCLEAMTHRVTVPPAIQEKAYRAVARMIACTEDRKCHERNSP